MYVIKYIYFRIHLKVFNLKTRFPVYNDSDTICNGLKGGIRNLVKYTLSGTRMRRCVITYKTKKRLYQLFTVSKDSDLLFISI